MSATLPPASRVIDPAQTNAQQKLDFEAFLKFLAERQNSVTTTGTSTAYLAVPDPAVSSYGANHGLYVNFHAACGVAPTLQINGIATPPQLVKQNAAGAYVNLEAGDIPINHRAYVLGLSATQYLVTDLPSARVNTNNSYTKNQAVTASPLTSGASIATNAALSNNFRITLAHNATLANPTGLVDGMVLNFRIKQDATGTRTLAYGTKFKWAGGAAPVLSTAANAVDFMSCYYDGTDDVLACSLAKGFA
jgi:hypothetical protein